MEKLRKTGLKLTPQRMAILEFLDGNCEHPAVEDIYKEIKKKFPMLSLATVYKNLDVLKENGLVRELTIDAERKHFDPDTHPHHHLICINCKKIVDIDSDIPIEIPDEQKASFEVTESHITFFGVCPECKKGELQ